MTLNANEKIYLNGHIDVPEEQIYLVKKALKTHIALTHEEIGCLSFKVEPCDVVSGRFIVSEIFIDQDSFDKHQIRTKNSEWFAITKGLERKYTIKKGEN